MNVTHGVIMDLLPLYLAGEASEETRSLVEEYLRQHPELAADVRRNVERSSALLAAAVAPPPAGTGHAETHVDLREKATLERVRRFNRHRSQLLGVAIWFSLLPFSVVHTDSIRWWMLRDNPQQAIGFWIAALGCWTAYYLVGRRVRTMA